MGVFNGTAGDDSIDGSEADDVIHGLAGNDLIRPLGGDDLVFGDDGHDSITGSGGNNTLDGGVGHDMVDYSHSPGPMTADLRSGLVTSASGTDHILNFEVFSFTPDADTVTGNDAGDEIYGNEGDDLIYGGAGDDWIDGGDGYNTIHGGAGNDYLRASDRLTGSADLYGDDGDDTLAASRHGGVVDGGPGRDTLQLAPLGMATRTSVDLTRTDEQQAFALAPGEASHPGLTIRNIEDVDASFQSQPVTLIGDDQSNRLIGGTWIDTLSGGGGDDTLTGGAGDDVIDGGSGVDLVTFAWPRSNFMVHTAKAGGVFVTTVQEQGGYSEGTDLVGNVERFSFLGKVFNFAGIQQNHQQNVDGGSSDDVLFGRTSTGGVYYATASGAGLAPVLGTLPAGWKAVGAADLVGDGHAWTLVQDSGTGSLYGFYLDASRAEVSGATVINHITGAWKFMGVGDVNGDGFVDVVLRDSTTGVTLYRDVAHSTWGSVLNAGLGWNVVGVGDFNRDGCSDVAIQNQSDGTVYYANMAGGTFTGWGLVTGAVGTDWKAVGVGDINGDGYADVVFQNQSNGLVYFVDMAGGSFNHWGVVAGVQGWTVRDVADVNNNGFADVVIQNNTDGTTYYADMRDGSFYTWGQIAGAIGTDWVVV